MDESLVEFTSRNWEFCWLSIMPINNKQQEIDLIFHMVIYSLNVISWLWIQSNQILAFETSIVVEFDANRDVCHLSLLFNKYSTSIVFFFFLSRWTNDCNLNIQIKLCNLDENTVRIKKDYSSLSLRDIFKQPWNRIQQFNGILDYL